VTVSALLWPTPVPTLGAAALTTLAAVAEPSRTDWWLLEDVAVFLDSSKSTVTAYRSRGQLPREDTLFGRSPAWRPKTIRDWAVSRPGHGWRKQA